MAGIKSIDRKSKLQKFKFIKNIKFKLCSKCKEYRELDNNNYHKSSLNNCGYKSQCKQCCLKAFNNSNYYKSKNINIEGLLICTRCKNFKVEDEFYNTPNNIHRKGKSTECVVCEKLRKYKSRRTTNPKIDLELHLKSLLNGCKARIKGLTKKGNYKNKELNISIEDIKNIFYAQKGKCKISGIEMTYFIGHGKQKYNISIDRIDCSLGYLKDNIQLVCSHINIMRGNLDIKDLVDICNKITLYNNENRN